MFSDERHRLLCYIYVSSCPSPYLCVYVITYHAHSSCPLRRNTSNKNEVNHNKCSMKCATHKDNKASRTKPTTNTKTTTTTKIFRLIDEKYKDRTEFALIKIPENRRDHLPLNRNRSRKSMQLHPERRPYK